MHRCLVLKPDVNYFKLKCMYLLSIKLLSHVYFLTGIFEYSIICYKGEPIPLFSDTFHTKYRAKNFIDTNPYSCMVACISHQMSYLPLGI